MFQIEKSKFVREIRNSKVRRKLSNHFIDKNSIRDKTEKLMILDPNSYNIGIIEEKRKHISRKKWKETF